MTTALLDIPQTGRYAVNLADLTRFVGPDGQGRFNPPWLLLNRILDPAEVICCEREQWDGMAVRVKSTIPFQQWQAVYTILRLGVGRWPPLPRHQLRIYHSITGHGGWSRV